MKNIAVLGSTGSIGRQTLEVVRQGGFKVTALTGGQNIDLLVEQAGEFKPGLVVTADEKGASAVKDRLKDMEISVMYGSDGLKAAASLEENDIVLNAVVGIAGLAGTLAAVETGKKLALANKESLVCAGAIVMPRARQTGCEIIPVDSEHSALFQALRSGQASEVETMILTASGGPFFGKKADELAGMRAEDALKHPSWSMGSKITIDSATLMNKGFELIEAVWLFDIDPQNVQIVVHRESIIHSAVEFKDGNVIAQLSNPDMRLPIQYALTHPLRLPLEHKRLNLAQIGKMSFFEPDLETFKCLPLCIKSARLMGNSGAVINGANEVAVESFLQGKIPFNKIYECVKYAFDKVEFIKKPTVSDIYETDKQARSYAKEIVNLSER